MTFKKCKVCGESVIIFDLTADGVCDDNCFASYDKHVGIRVHTPGTHPMETQQLLDKALALCKTFGTAREAGEILRGQNRRELLDHVPTLAEQFGFTQPEDGSENRYDERRDQQPAARHAFWWWLHNCVAHPLIGLVPRRFAFEFHDWTSRKLHGK